MTSIIRSSHLFALLFLALFLSADGRLSLGTIGKLGTKAVSAAKELNTYLVNAGDGACWQESYGRGAGEPLSSCRPGEQKNGALCYPACPSNLPNGVGPVCWSVCASGYTDDGAVCRRNAQIISADNGNCPWYDKCGLTFSRGCSSCPAGWQNDGCTCRIDANIYAKQSRGRGAGTPLVCRSGLEQDGGLCYQPCMQGFKAVGPVCWAHCAGQYSSDCGAMCTTTSAACASRMVDLSLSILSDITAAVTGNLFSAATGLVDIAKDLALPICGRKYTDVELAAFKAARQLRRKRR